MSLFPLFQTQIRDDDFATGREAANLGRDDCLFASRGLGQSALENFHLLLAVPPLPQFLVSLDRSAHAAMLPQICFDCREPSKLSGELRAVNGGSKVRR